MRHIHVLLTIVGALSVACSPFDAEVNPDGRALTGFLTDHVDTVTALHALSLLIEQRDTEVEDGCELIRRDGVTFGGGAVDESNGLLMGGTTSGGATLDGPYGPYCGAMGLNADVAPRDGLIDGELIIDSGGGRAQWKGRELFAERRFAPLVEMSVARGDSVQLRYEPASDVVSGVSASLLHEETSTSFALDAEVDENHVVTITIPEDAPSGSLALDVTSFFLIGSACEGFSSCEIEGVHDEAMPITIRP